MSRESLSAKLKEACTISVKLLPQVRIGEVRYGELSAGSTSDSISTLLMPEDSKPAILGISAA
jgi:hypothetical protein